jgi:hypothetical protein
MPRPFDHFPLVLLHPMPDGAFICQGFSGGHLAEPVFIVVAAAATYDRDAAADVGWDLARQIGLLPEITEHRAVPWHPLQEFAGGLVTHSQRRNIYVRVSGGPPDDLGGNRWDRRLAPVPADENWLVMVTVPSDRGGGIDPWLDTQARFPEGCDWQDWNAFRWDRSAREIVPAVIARAGLAPAENRVFISYIRRETTTLASQLFAALTERGYDVFLDRFSVPPAVRFQDRLMQELDDKAVVVLLHSVGIAKRTSPWVEQELSRVKQYDHGLVVFRIPDTAGAFEPLRLDLSPEIVHDLSRADIHRGKLRGDALAEAIAKVGEAHARSLVRRRRELRESLGGELEAAGKALHVHPGGDMECGSTGVMVRVSPRPPNLGDYSCLHSRHGLGGSRRGACLTPAPLVLLERQADLQWLDGVSAIEHIDQENVKQFVSLRVT